jgi:predicted negative regulator of RcsB-dependent stress response
MKPLRLAVVTSMVLVPARALADEPALSERDRNVARESVYQGDDLVKRGDTRGALEAYRRANAIMKVPTTGIEVARTSLRLGLLVEALEASRQTAA